MHYLVYPCFCLCLGFLQITITTPCLRTTLHFSHRFLTDALIFIVLPFTRLLVALAALSRSVEGNPKDYFTINITSCQPTGLPAPSFARCPGLLPARLAVQTSRITIDYLRR